MRIAMRLQAFPRLSETFILNQVQFLLEKDIEVHLFLNQVIYSSPNKLFNRKNLHLHIAPSQKNINFLSRRIFRKIQNIKNVVLSNIESFRCKGTFVETKIPSDTFDIFHCQYAVFLPEVINDSDHGAYQYKKLITNGRGYDVTSEFLKSPEAYRNAFPKIDLFLPVAKSLARNYLQNGFDSKKIKVLHSGINLNAFPFSIYQKNRYPHLRVITVGRLVEKKGHLETIKAIEILVQKGMGLKLSILGDGPQREELEKYIHDKSLQDVVTLLGAQSHHEVIKYISDSDLFVLSCLTGKDGNQEGIPNVLKEAMALGVPLVTTRHSGNEELMPAEYQSFLSEEGDIEGMANNIERLFSLETSELNTLLLKNRQIVERRFDIKILTEDLLSIYRSLEE